MITSNSIESALFIPRDLTPRSQKYQNVFCEVFVPEFFFDHIEDPQESYERECKLEDLKSELFQEVLKIAQSDEFSKRQREVFEMTFIQNMTQEEIAKKLGINQSTITKTIHGSPAKYDPSFHSKRKRRVSKSNNKNHLNAKGILTYGGIEKKLKNLSATNQRIQEILKEIEELA